MEGSPNLSRAPIVTLSFFLLPFPSFITSSSGLSSLVCKYFNQINSNAFWHKAFPVHSAVFYSSVASLQLWMKHNKTELLMLLEGTSWADCYLLLCQSNHWALRRWIAAHLVWYGVLLWKPLLVSDYSKPFPSPLSLIYLCTWKQSRFQGI